MIAKVVLAR